MTSYYGVIGNRDYIKYQGEKRPFWEFLDQQSDGWLTSIVYAREDLPGGRMIFDCGAWSYRENDTPTIGKNTVTPEWALAQYQQRTKPGDFVIAPDHMLIPGVDLDARRAFNRQSARDFLKLVKDTQFVPMATVHGMDLNERIQQSIEYRDMGYKALALGGMAARASQKRLLIDMVAQIRVAVPDVWLHVLGLSSPDYAAAWNEIGVNSFDGSSHFKQAFTAGAFFTRDGSKLIKHQAARPGEELPEDMPICDCKACSMMREDGIDTRTYGSNQNNMGRAAHNLNILMQAQRVAIAGRVCLVACVGEKMDIPDNVAVPAGILYQSAWFKKAREYAEGIGHWYIISARYGLVAPDEEIYTYNETLNEYTVNERKEWADRVATEFMKFNPDKPEVVILAGSKYREFLIPTLTANGYSVTVPMEGLGIGQQLQWLDNHNKPDNQQLSLF